MERNDRIKYLDEHEEETLYQIKKTAESTYNLLKDIMPEMTMDGELDSAKKWIYEQAEDDEYSNCQEMINGIDLKEYIDKIRFDRKKENNLEIYIKNGQLIKNEVCTTGNIEKLDVKIEDYINKLIKNAKECGADKVCIIHNHPCNFSAKPSKQDLNGIKIIGETLKKENIELADSGIITIDDYWSYKQKKDLD